MRHNVVGKKLGRDTAHRKALLRNLSDSLILSESITTTVAKAKYLRPYVEKLITDAKKSTSFSSQRLVVAKMNNSEASKKLFSDLAKRFLDRNGGYTRIVKTGNRDGDNAEMARIEFVDLKAEAPEKKKIEKKEDDKKETEKKETPTLDIDPIIEAHKPKISKKDKIITKAPHTGVREKG